MNKNKLIILTGPSCVGKTPLIKAFQKLYPQQSAKLKKIVLYNSRPPRPSEKEGIDYYFRDRKDIEEFRNNDNFIIMEVRGDLQALDKTKLLKQLKDNDVFYEGNAFIAKLLLQHPLLNKVNKKSIFLSPFSLNEIEQFKAEMGEERFEKFVFDTMKAKSIRRTKKYGQELTKKVQNNIDRRAADAYNELKEAKLFDFVIPNHDGEDSENWKEPIPKLSDAYLSVQEFWLLLKNEKTNKSEKWDK